MTSLVLNRRNRFQLQQQLKHTRDAALYRRTLAILEIDQGKPPTVVAEALGVTRQSVYNWIEIYAKTYDPLSLVDESRSGRPSSWTPDLEELLPKLLKESPRQWGFQGVNWTVPLLRQQLASWDGRWLAKDTIRRQLHKLGYVWKRPRYVLPADPEGEKKKGDSPEAQKPASA
jgi:transposase